MPVRTPFFLETGERLNRDECLVSPDGRFRLYVEEYGLVAYHYHRVSGIRRYFAWGRDGAGIASAELAYGNPRDPRMQLFMADGGGGLQAYCPAWNTMPHPPWDILHFVLQDDGNGVLYLVHPQSGTVGVGWSIDTHTGLPGLSSDFVPPNTYILNVPATGTVYLEPNVGDTALVNESGSAAAVEWQGTIYPVAPNSEISAVIPAGTLGIQTNFYEFQSLRGPNGTAPVVNSGDALGAIPRPAPGQRRRISILSGGGLRLTGSVMRPLSLKASVPELHMAGARAWNNLQGEIARHQPQTRDGEEPAKRPPDGR